MKRLAAAFVLTLLAPTALAAGDSAFLSRFNGAWSGTGSVIRNAESGVTNVRCTLKGTATETSVRLAGTCRAYLIFSRDLSADLNQDPATGRFTGTYVGSKVGPASLSGRRSGDVISLTVTWPKPVNGDTHATMVIRNPGSGRFTFEVLDALTAGGPIEQTTDVTFQAAR